MTAISSLLSWRRAAGALLALVAVAGALAQPPLQLDPGAHWAPAHRIAVSATQDLVATASDEESTMNVKRVITTIALAFAGTGAFASEAIQSDNTTRTSAEQPR